ncbi:MAG: metal ABC transporter substrate-binding protein [Kiritimatiellia bacterium]|nr:metal ABC transporter substrate-binding protein [Kiritimatiellia bacterium]
MKTIVYLVSILTTAICPLVNTGADELKIVTTTSDLAAIAKAVAGDKAIVKNICRGYEDPHFMQAKPSYIVRARDAGLWIRIGAELEIGWEMPVLDGSRNSRIRPGTKGHLDASESVQILEIPTVPVTRAMGDVHPLGNPHYWLDPLNARRIAGAIAERLAELSPGNAAFFRQNAVSFQKALDEKMFGPELIKSIPAERLWAMTEDNSIAAFLCEDANKDKTGGWIKTMQPLRGQKIVTYHKSWIYFTHRFGISVAAELEPKPGIPPTASHLKEVEEIMKAENIKIILQEPFYSVKAAETVAGKTGARVVVVANSVGGDREVVDYVSLIDLIIKRITEGK